MRRQTRPWITKAENDYEAAQCLARGKKLLRDQICFHCQQTAEKYLKALLEELGLPVPKIRVLEELLALLTPHYPDLRKLRRGAVFLSRYAVETRYPGEGATKRQTQSALRWTGRIRDTIRSLLGI